MMDGYPYGGRRDPSTFDFPPAVPDYQKQAFAEYRTERDRKTVDVDGGDEGPWSLAVGDRVQNDLDGKTGTVQGFEQPMRWDELSGKFIACLTSHPDHQFFAVKVKWDSGIASSVSALQLRAEGAKVHLSPGAFYSAATLQGKPVPAREWLVDDLIPSGTVTLLGGDGGTGKSLLSLQLAAAVALGSPWIGRSVAGGKAVYISAEDDEDELHRRIADVARAQGIELCELSNLTLRSLAGLDALLAMQDGPSSVLRPSALFNALDLFLGDLGPSLVVLDTLADLFPGNENDRAQARQFIGMLRGLSIRHKCAVVLLAHPSLSGLNSGAGTSGSTGWNNSVRSRLYFERVMQDNYEANPDARVLRTMKANYGRTGGEIGLTWRGGVFVTDTPNTGLDRMAGNAKAERVFLKLLGLFTEQGRRVNHAGGSTYAPKVFAEHPQSEGVTKRAFRTAMESLLADGRFTIATEGPASKTRQFLLLAGGA
jgi:RecA-family ATPase